MGGSGPSCLPTSSHLGQSAGEVSGLSVQENHSDCSRVAHHALVLGPNDHVSEVSLRQWQHGLKVLRECQPNQSMRLSGPFLQSGATVIS